MNREFFERAKYGSISAFQMVAVGDGVLSLAQMVSRMPNFGMYLLFLTGVELTVGAIYGAVNKRTPLQVFDTLLRPPRNRR